MCQLAFPIGFVVLVLIVVGAATVASERSPAAWVALTAAFALLALGSAQRCQWRLPCRHAR
jgi:hypothetical protein